MSAPALVFGKLPRRHRRIHDLARAKQVLPPEPCLCSVCRAANPERQALWEAQRDLVKRDLRTHAFRCGDCEVEE